MKKSTISKQWSYLTDLFSTLAVKSHRRSTLWLMLFTLLLLPTRMVAETTTEDPRCALFKGLEGISDVTITDNGEYPWQMLDLKADGMENLGFTIPDGSKGLMSSNYHVDGSSSETVVNFTVEKPMLLMFKYLVSSEEFDEATITLDNKKSWTISEIEQIEIKALLSVGKHSLKLSYTKDNSDNENADRTCIYDLKTATTFSEYVADYVATNSTLTFKKITSDNLEGLDLSRMAVVDNIDMVQGMVQNVCTNYSSIKNIVFDESFKTYAPTSLSGFFGGCETLETISGLEYLNTANVEFMDHMFYGCSALKSLDLTNFNTAKVTDMGNMFYGCSALTSLDLTKFNTAKVEFMYHMFEGCSALKSLDLTNFNTAKVTDMSFMFYGCSALTSLDLTNFNTAKVVKMGFMFEGCSALTSLDLTNFNTANVTDMSFMFYGCSALTSLDLTNFNTAKVEFMDNMFEGCSALTTIYASDKFDTDNVKYGSDMFTGCKSLKDYSDSKTDHTYAYCGGTDGYFTPGGCGYAEFDNATGTLSFRYKGVKPEGAYDLNVGGSDPEWKTLGTNVNKVVFDASFANARPTSCYYWFCGCSKLTDIEGIENLNTEKVTNMNSMFDRCSALTSLDLTNFNTAKVSDMSYMFMGCSALTTIFVSDKFVTDLVTSSDNMFHMCINLIGAIEYDGSKSDHTYANYETGYFTPEGGFHAYAEFNEGTGTLTFRRGVSKPEGAYALNEGDNDPEWYEKQNRIQDVVFDASFANARPTSCKKWFSDCSNLTDIVGIEYLNTEDVTDMSYMFYNCQNLNSLDLTSFNTANVTDMNHMFYGCYRLASLDLTSFNTANVTNMSYMFYNCKVLTSLNVTNFNTANVTSMTGMFGRCSALQSLNLTNFNTANVTIMSGMFDNCSALQSIDLTSFNTANVMYMSYIFNGCNALTSLDVTNFNTEKVKDMSNMFNGCNALTSLDLTSFDTKEVINMSKMFWDSSTLTTIYVSDKFVTTKVSSGSEMFKGCTSLKGAIDKYEDSKIDHTYANYETGYFTKLVGKNGEEKIGAAGEPLTTDNLVLADDKDFVAYEPFTAKAASYSRTINAGTTWGTLCLPFEVSIDGQNFRAFKLLSADDATETVELEELKTIEAGTPVIIKMTNGATELEFSEANKAIAKDVQTSKTDNSNYQLQGLYTQKEFSQDTDNNCYIVKGNKLMNPAKLLENSKVTKVASKPFRAYMVDNTSAASGAKMFSIGFDDSITTIDTINTIANDKAEYYDLQGKRLNEPQKGINIVKRGGKTMKVIIK